MPYFFRMISYEKEEKYITKSPQNIHKAKLKHVNFKHFCQKRLYWDHSVNCMSFKLSKSLDMANRINI